MGFVLRISCGLPARQVGGSWFHDVFIQAAFEHHSGAGRTSMVLPSILTSLYVCFRRAV